MHWVERGPEPARLGSIRARYTPDWVSYYPNRVGQRPWDRAWQSFRNDLWPAFLGMCAYCEQPDRGEVDHFHPKSKFPEKVYEWTNWLFSCHSCNQAKGEKWPKQGYVDPCAEDKANRPEHFFDFSLDDGRIVPRDGLNSYEKSIAKGMIEDLKLNEWYHLTERSQWIDVLNALDRPLTPEKLLLVQQLANRSERLSSVTRTWLENNDYAAVP